MVQRDRCTCPAGTRWQKTALFALIIAVGTTSAIYVYLTGHSLLAANQRVSKRVHITSAKLSNSDRHLDNPLVQLNLQGGNGKTAGIAGQDFQIQGSANQGSLLADTRPGYQNVSQSVNSTGTVLQDAMRRKMDQTAGKKKRRWSWMGPNSYIWNDRDRELYPELPLRGKDDRDWKKEEALIFNRVHKTASRTVIHLLRKLADANNFNLLCSKAFNASAIDEKWQRYIVKTLEQVKTPYLFQKHVHFIDFTKFDAKQPMYINIIRDPLSRFVSNYYFKRFGDTTKKDMSMRYRHSNKTIYRSVTECILESRNECAKKAASYIIPYFCGQQRACREPSQWALERAKQNVEKHFVVVGTLEDLENSFRVLEKVLPRYFTGMVKLFNDPAQNLKNSSFVTKKREGPSPEAAAIMKRVMHYEYDFYDFVKDRLERQKAQYGIK